MLMKKNRSNTFSMLIVLIMVIDDLYIRSLFFFEFISTVTMEKKNPYKYTIY